MREIKKIYCCFVPTKKQSASKPIDKPAEVQYDARIKQYIYSNFVEKIERICITPIKFNENPEHINHFRALVEKVITGKNQEAVHDLARRLSTCSDERTRAGLMIVVTGKNENKDFVLTIRFRCDSINSNCNNEIYSHILNNPNKYKIAFFETDSIERKKIKNGRVGSLQNAKYWINGFLESVIDGQY